MSTHCLIRVRGDAQGFLQAAAVLVHAQGEVSVAFVHSCHPFFDLSSVTVAFLAEAISQLDQQFHTLLSLLRDKGEDSVICKDTNVHTVSCCMCACPQPWL